MELKRIESSIDFSELLENRIRNNFQELIKLLTDFRIIYDDETDKLPYHINVIDELHADENAHSRIFAKLLRYKKNNKYPFLENFLNDICNFNVCIENPKIEKVDSCGRIDIPIFDKKYVVVIENKVTDKAPDQNTLKGGQLARYIETIKNNYARNLEDIFVVYTPKYTREPSDECWENKDGFSYKDSFKSRFSSLSYKDDIYPWLKEKRLSIVEEKDIYLQSAVEQYLDHLEGIFSLRTTNKKMNMKLQEFIKQELKLIDKNPEEAIEILSDKEMEMNNAIGQIQLLKSKYQIKIVENHFQQWEKLLQIDFPNLKIIGDKFEIDNNVINVGIKFSIENKDFVAIIECNNCDKLNIYYGIGRQFVSNEKFETTESLRRILNDNELNEPEDFWYGWKYTPLESAYYQLKNLINQIQSTN